MPIFIKENEALKGNFYKIPDDVDENNREILATYKNFTKNKGYKRLNALTNPEYNKRSDKADQFKDGKHISFSDLKRIDHEFRHMNNSPKNLDYVLNGGEKMQQFAKNTLNRERTKVKPVEIVKQIKDNNRFKVSKASIKPNSLEVGEISVNVHENKKIYINERQLNMLNENIDK